MSIPDAVASKAIADLKAFKAKEKLSDWALAKKVGVGLSTMTKWLGGKGKPFASNIQKMINAGVTTVMLPEDARKKALQRIMETADSKNRIPRAYRKAIVVPELINAQMKLVLDAYVKGLKETRTWEEHENGRDITIQKLYHLAKQGE